MSKIRTYTGQSASITWDQNRCIHAEECVRGSGQLFDPGRKPWIQPDAAEVEVAERVVARCPTGALAVIRASGPASDSSSTQNSPDSAMRPDNAVQVVPNGPLYLRGEVVVGQEPAAPRLALCRCGHSSIKPYCDGAHTEAAFHEPGAVAVDLGADELAHGARGPLKVNAAENGPLLVNGEHTISAGSGRVAARATKSALCRCGASANMPFCDGSHVAAEFKAPGI